jgi:hypothetical protein
LRHRTPTELAELLRARSDLLHPMPTDMADLARRAATTGSIRRALLGLDRRGLRVAAAVAAMPGPVAVPELMMVLAPADDQEAADSVAAVLADLTLRGLLWSDGERLHAVREFRDTVERVLMPPPEAGTAPPPDLAVDSWADPVPTPTGDYGPEHVDQVAGQQGLLVSQTLVDVVGAVVVSEPRLLRSGAVPTRELDALAAALDLPVSQVCMWLELAVMLGLLGPSPEQDLLLPTVAFEGFQDLGPATVWAAAAAVWWGSQRAWERSAEGEAERLEPLGEALASGLVGVTRGRWAELFDRVPPGQGIAVQEAQRVLAVKYPLVDRARQDRIVTAIEEQAETLGVTGRGALSSLGRWLVAAGDVPTPDPLALAETTEPALVSRAAELLPPPVDHLLLQADLTIVAPGPLAPEVSRRLRDLAEVESTGVATVYRLSVATIERAIDRGWTATSLMEFLEALSSTPVPQTVSYLVADTVERHGRLRAGPAASYLQVSDPAELDLAVAAAAQLGLVLRPVSDTVAVSGVAPESVVAGLRGAGLPVLSEGADGTVGPQLAGPLAHVLTWPPRIHDESRASEALVQAAIVALQHSENPGSDPSQEAVDAAGPAPQIERMHSAQVQAVLASALAGGRQVWVRHADNAGAASVLLVSPISLSGGAFRALDLAVGRPRLFALARIVGACPVVGKTRS